MESHWSHSLKGCNQCDLGVYLPGMCKQLTSTGIYFLKATRRFLLLLTIMLVVIIGGIMLILMSIAREQTIDGPMFIGNSTQLMMTNDWINTAIAATATAKS